MDILLVSSRSYSVDYLTVVTSILSLAMNTLQYIYLHYHESGLPKYFHLQDTYRFCITQCDVWSGAELAIWNIWFFDATVTRQTSLCLHAASTENILNVEIRITIVHDFNESIHQTPGGKV